MEKKIITSRVFEAPIERAWKAWTDAELVKKWWGPAKFRCPTAKIDFREGGVSLVSMKAPKEFGGQESFNLWAYKRIIPMERIEFVQTFSDKNGNKLHPAQIGMPPDFPEEITTVVTFKDLGNGRTEMTVVQNADLGQMTKMATMGMAQSLDKMETLFTL